MRDDQGPAPSEIKICERCFAPIDDGEPHASLAHIDRARPDGTIAWRHSYIHAATADVRAGDRRLVACST